MNISEKQIQDLRTQFLNKLERTEPDVLHPADINKVKTDDNYLKRFLLHNDGNSEAAFNMLWDTCEWRKKFGANDITEKSVNQSLLELGSVFSHGKDKDGKTLLIFKSKKHVKGAFDFEDHKKCLVYWMERLERQENGDMISIFFDMDGAGRGNMDMDYTKYLINLFKNYYPHFLNYIIIYEMAWILNALFRVIKSWLPPKAVEKMKFVSKSNVKEFVDPEYALKSWGGNDDFVYQFEQEGVTKNVVTSSSAGSGEDNKKKVHFADTSLKQDTANESIFEDSSPVTSQDNTTRLIISPSDVMTFSQEGSEITSTISLKNEDSKCMSFKIKTTSPEKFRVRPSAGVLNAGANATINVVLLPGYFLQALQRDKFLIMSIPIDHSDISLQELNEIWKRVGDKEIHQHKLRCLVPQASSNDFGMKNGSAFNSQSTEDQKVSKLCSEVGKLSSSISNMKEEMRLIRQQQWIIVFGLILILCSLSFIMYNDYVNPLSQGCWADSRKKG